MQDSPAQIWTKHLIDQGVAVGPNPTGTAWGIVSGPLPLMTSPGGTGDRFISVQDTGAVHHGKVQQTGERSTHPTVIVTVRSPFDYNQGWDKCQEIEAKGDAIGVFGTGGGPYWPTVQVGGTGGNSYTLKTAHVYIETTPLGFEEQSHRQLFSINFTIIVVPVP